MKPATPTLSVGSPTVTAGSDVALKCRYTGQQGNQQVKYHFFKDGQSISTPSFRDTFHKHNVETSDTGDYTCRVTVHAVTSDDSPTTQLQGIGNRLF